MKPKRLIENKPIAKPHNVEEFSEGIFNFLRQKKGLPLKETDESSIQEGVLTQVFINYQFDSTHLPDNIIHDCEVYQEAWVKAFLTELENHKGQPGYDALYQAYSTIDKDVSPEWVSGHVTVWDNREFQKPDKYIGTLKIRIFSNPSSHFPKLKTKEEIITQIRVFRNMSFNEESKQKMDFSWARHGLDTSAYFYLTDEAVKELLPLFDQNPDVNKNITGIEYDADTHAFIGNAKQLPSEWKYQSESAEELQKFANFFYTQGLIESGKPVNDDEPDKSVEKKKQAQKEKYPVTGHTSSFESTDETRYYGLGGARIVLEYQHLDDRQLRDLSTKVFDAYRSNNFESLKDLSINTDPSSGDMWQDLITVYEVVIASQRLTSFLHSQAPGDFTSIPIVIIQQGDEENNIPRKHEVYHLLMINKKDVLNRDESDISIRNKARNISIDDSKVGSSKIFKFDGVVNNEIVLVESLAMAIRAQQFMGVHVYPLEMDSFEEHGDTDGKEAKFSDLPKNLQQTLRTVHKMICDKVHLLLKEEKYSKIKSSKEAMKNINKFCSPISPKGDVGSVTSTPQETMIQITGHFKNNQSDEMGKLLHQLISQTYRELKLTVKKAHDIRLDNEGAEASAGFEGFDAYPSTQVAKEIWNKLSGNIIKESGDSKTNKPPTPEYNTDMTEAQAKKTLGTLTASIIADFEKNKNHKVSQYTMNIYANIITKNLLPIWAKGWKKFSITSNTDNYHNNLANVEFLTPPFTQDFVSRFIHGRESLNGHLRRRPEIRMKVTSGIFRDMKHRDDAYNFFKEAVRYYDSQVEKAGRQLMSEVMKLGHNMKHLIGNSKLSGLVTLPLVLLFRFDNVNMSEKGTFKLSLSDIQTVNKFIRNISSRYAAPEKEKREIIDDVKEMIRELREFCGPTEDILELGYFPEALEMLYFEGFTKMIQEASKQFIDDQVDNKYIPESMQSRFMYEKWGVKRLKKIPRDLIAYITIETEAIKDSNDKQMIVSYILGKVEIVEWYIELLNVGSKKYIVPHPLSYLQMVRTELLNCFNNAMKVKVVNPANKPLIQIQYPIGYEG